ncbi:MAG: cytochrome c [Gallionellaceae bacterium]|nr:cytochrome c [Gallionellaceae bacterium]
MKNVKLKACLVAITGLGLIWATSPANAAVEKRCKAGGVKVECPTQSDDAVKKAAEAYGREAADMSEGKGGSTYGIAPFDYLTGVGKQAESDTKTFKTHSGYGEAKGSYKTELWGRVKKPGATVEETYNQWTNQWSPKFGTTGVPGADPTEGKQWYYSYCIACHGWLLHGDGPSAVELNPRPRTLTKGDYMQKKTNLELFQIIKGGGEAGSLSSSMPGWGNLLMDQDIWNVVAFIRAMQDVPPPKSVEEYLNPKSTFKPIKGDVDALTAAKDKDFKEANEMMEADMAGRDGAGLVGSGFVEGGLRKKATDITLKVGK